MSCRAHRVFQIATVEWLRSFFALALVVTAGPVLAATYSTPVPELVGPFSDEIPRLFEFDFGIEFKEITGVRLQIEATATPAEWDYCGTIFEPIDPCEHRVVPLSLFAFLDNESGPPKILISTPLGPFPPPGNPAAVEVGSFPASEFSQLLDGSGLIDPRSNRLVGSPDDITGNFVFPTYLIVEASILLEATPVPEPTSDALTCAALLSLFLVRYQHDRKARRGDQPHEAE